MIQETINKIAEIEKEADTIIKTALEDAKQTVAHAEEESKTIRSEIREKVKKERRDVIKQANQDADKQYEEILKEAEQACSQLKKATNNQLAVKLIVEKIHDKYKN